jgi:hypothetical protein
MPNLGVVGICNAAQRIEMSLDDRRKLRVPSVLEAEDAKGDGNEPRETFEPEELRVCFGIAAEVRFEGCRSPSLLTVRPLAQKVVALEEE